MWDALGFLGAGLPRVPARGHGLFLGTGGHPWPRALGQGLYGRETAGLDSEVRAGAQDTGDLGAGGRKDRLPHPEKRPRVPAILETAAECLLHSRHRARGGRTGRSPCPQGPLRLVVLRKVPDSKTDLAGATPR